MKRKNIDNMRMTLTDSAGKVLWDGTHKTFKQTVRRIKAKDIADRAEQRESLCCCDGTTHPESAHFRKSGKVR